MNKHILIAALAALTLAACGNKGSGGSGTPTPETPQVGVENNAITVKPDPIQFAKEKKDVKISWQLPSGSAFTFPQNGIRFNDGIEEGNTKSAREEFVKCTVEGKGEAYSCINLHTVPGKYKYWITLQGGDKTPPPLDPIVVND